MKRRKILVLILTLLLCLGIVECISMVKAPESIVEVLPLNKGVQEGESLKVHYIDVGQADCH